MIVSISGPPGSGKTTVAEELSARLGMDLLLTGQIFRKMAGESGMSLEDFGLYAETHPEVDIELDRRVIEEVKRLSESGHDVILEGRLAGYMLHRNGIPSYRVFITAEPDIRAVRIRKREEADLEEIMRKMKEREMCERERYLRTYSFDLNDTSIYDLVIDSTDMSVDDVVSMVLAGIERWRA